MWKKKRKMAVLLSFLSFLLVISCSGCTADTESPKPLWVLLEGYHPYFPPDNYDIPTRFLYHLEYVTGISREDVNVEFLPDEESERAVRLASLRTEIMSGGGPDVFIMRSNPISEENSKYWQKTFWKDSLMEKEQLFPNIRASMENGLFLPLDEYLPSAQYLNIDSIHPVVLSAGTTKDGQVLLPITFTFPVAVYEKNKLEQPDCFPASWQEATSWSDPTVRAAYGGFAKNQFSLLFPELWDTSSEKLLFSRGELLQRVKEALKLEQGLSPEQDRIFPVRFLHHFEAADMSPGLYYDRRWNGSVDDVEWWTATSEEQRQSIAEAPQIMQPLYNTEGGVSAGITSYVCVNRNTKRPEDAFRVVDFLFKTEVQSCRGENDVIIEGLCRQSEYHIEFFGIPARNDLLKDAKYSFGDHYLGQLGVTTSPNEELFSEYTALRNEVTHARFYGTLDQELQAMYEACLEAENDEEIEKIVSKAYDTMLMILAES